MIEINEKRILEASEACPEAKRVLETLFPEVFKKPSEEFKVGDIVRYKDKGLGIIKEISGRSYEFQIGVEFIKEIPEGHELNDSGVAKSNPGHGFWCYNDEVILVYRPK